MKPSVIELYERLSTAPDERTRAKIIVEAFDELESRYPNLTDMATERALSETELRLKLEIEKTHVKIEEVRADLSKDIERVRADLSKEIEKTHVKIEEVRADLSKEIEKTRGDLGKEIERTKVELLKWSFAFWFTTMSVLSVLAWRLFSL